MIRGWAVAGALVGGRAPALDADAVLDGSRVVAIQVTLPPDDWEALRRESQGPVGLFAAGPPAKFTWRAS